MAILLVTGCQTFNAGNEDNSFIMLAPVAPPALIDEPKPVLQDLRAQIWRPGYWTYTNGTFNWVSGTVIDRPSPTAVWASDRWVWHEFGWGFEAGHWQ